MNQNNEKCPEIETPVTEDVINRTTVIEGVVVIDYRFDCSVGGKWVDDALEPFEGETVRLTIERIPADAEGRKTK